MVDPETRAADLCTRAAIWLDIEGESGETVRQDVLTHAPALLEALLVRIKTLQRVRGSQACELESVYNQLRRAEVDLVKALGARVLTDSQLRELLQDKIATATGDDLDSLACALGVGPR